MDTSEQGPGTSTTCTSPNAAERLKQGLQALAAGKRHLLTKEIPMALASLEEGCKILDQVRGTFSKESGDAHFYYGRALLEQSRIENGLFEDGTGMGVIGPEDYEEDVEDEEEEDEDEDAEEAPELVAVPEEQVRNGNGTKKEEAQAGNGVEAKPNANLDQEPAQAPEPTEGQNGSEDQENVPPKSPALSTSSSASSPNTLELAWEVLEVAKLAFTRQLETITTQEEVDTVKRRLADVHLVLGEVATESEQYPQAIQDFDTAIQLLESLNGGAGEREVSQCFFQKGLALVFAKRFADGIAAFKRAKELVESRIAELPASSEEAAELRVLLPELEEKIADTEETERDEQVQDEKMNLGEEAPVEAAAAPAEAPKNANGNGNAAEKPINDISHLVRRKAPAPAEPADEQQQKRKLDEEEAVDGVVPPPEKKQCTE